jgi:hypothetical protein
VGVLREAITVPEPVEGPNRRDRDEDMPLKFILSDAADAWRKAIAKDHPISASTVIALVYASG